MNIDFLLVSSPSNIFYLTGFRGLSPLERESLFLIDRNNGFLIIPKMYRESAQNINSNLINIEVKNDRDDLFTMIKLHFHSNNIVGIEDKNITLREFNLLNKFDCVIYKNILNLCENLRVKKDFSELTLIRKAAEITDKAFSEIVKFIKP